jgi:23S rRNA (guanine2535-N1)-methyltransferase
VIKGGLLYPEGRRGRQANIREPRFMSYQFVKEQQDYSDLASGRVFHSLPGHPAFPVRLASEIFQRCMANRETIYQNSSRCVLYDPCCGAAYHLGVVAYLHRERIQEVIGSDIDEKAVALAKRNLELVGIAGLDNRIIEISAMFERYGKDSHKDALRSAQILRSNSLALERKYPVKTRVFRANATEGEEIFNTISAKSVDIVFADVPYGQHSDWYNPEGIDPIQAMLDVLMKVLSGSSLVAITSDKRQKVSHEKYRRIEQFQIGKRRVVILKPV